MGKADKVEKALYTWFTDAQARDVPVTTIVLEEKARQFATDESHNQADSEDEDYRPAPSLRDVTLGFVHFEGLYRATCNKP